MLTVTRKKTMLLFSLIRGISVSTDDESTKQLYKFTSIFFPICMLGGIAQSHGGNMTLHTIFCVRRESRL